MVLLIEKYKRMNIQTKAALWFVICNVLQKGISFITVPIFTRIMTTDQYGTYSLYLSWLQIMAMISSLYLYAGVFNNGMTKYDDDRDTYISAMQGITTTVTTLLFVIFLLMPDIWVRIIGLPSYLILMMFIEMLVTPAIHFWTAKSRFELRYQRIVLITLAKSLLNPLFGLILVFSYEEKAIARIFSVVLVELFFCGSLYVYQFIKGKVFWHRKYWKYALKLAIPLLPHYLSGVILNQGDRIMIDKMVGTSAVALYSVAYNIGMLIQLITQAIGNAFTPWVYKKIKAKDCRGIAKTTNSLLIIVTAVSLCLMLCSPELMHIFGSAEYVGAAYSIPPIAASVFFIFLYSLIAIPQFYFEKTQYMMISSLIAAAVNIGLNYICINLFGYVAAGYTTLICYVLYCLGHCLITRKITDKYMEGEKLFDYRFMLIMSVVIIIVCILSNFMFANNILRYVVLLGCLIVGYICRERIISVLMGMR